MYGSFRISLFVCIHIYNLVHAPPKTVQSATLQAAKVFSNAGIGTTWQELADDSPEAHLLDLNNSVKTRPYLVVRLMRSQSPKAYAGALGFALPFASSGVSVEIFYDRIESQAESAGLPYDTVLAYAMAHEIGHVLLRTPVHVTAGIMSTHWDAETWRLASFGMLTFLPEQAKRMREGLRSDHNMELAQRK